MIHERRRHLGGLRDPVRASTGPPPVRDVHHERVDRPPPRHASAHQLLRVGDRQPRARVRGGYRLRRERARAPPARVRRPMAAAPRLLAGRRAREDRRRRREGPRRRRDPPPLRPRGHPGRVPGRALPSPGARDAVRDRPAHGARVLQRRVLRRARDADGGARLRGPGRLPFRRRGARARDHPPPHRGSHPRDPVRPGPDPARLGGARERCEPLLRQRRGERAVSDRPRRGGDAGGLHEAPRPRDLPRPHHPRARPEGHGALPRGERGDARGGRSPGRGWCND